jgi:hypothetical protein
MNKILHINVGGYPFSIDLDAFDQLDRYLITLQNHFSKSEGHKEIISDIEHRMAELFQEKLLGRSIVSKDVVDQCIQIMGTPEVFGAEWTSESGATEIKPANVCFETLRIPRLVECAQV